MPGRGLPMLSRNEEVAMNIRMPGMPNAQDGPQASRMRGMSSDAKKEPKLMIQ